MTTIIKAFAIALALFSAAAFAETGEKLTELDMSVLSGKKISKAYFRTQDEKKWSEIKEGQRLHRGDEIRTKSGAELVLFIGKSTVTLGPMSRMTVEQSLENGGGDRPERNRDGKENAPPSAGIPPEKVPIFNK